MQKSNQVVLQKLHCIHAARRGYSAACARCARPHTNHALVNLQVRSGNRTTLYVHNVHVCTLVLQNRAEIHKLNRGIRSLFLVKLCSSLGIQTNLQWRKWVLYLCQIFLVVHGQPVVKILVVRIYFLVVPGARATNLARTGCYKLKGH